MKDDGLNKWQRHRLKDLEAYRKRKAAYARTPEQKEKRTKYMQKYREKNREAFNTMCNLSHAKSRAGRSSEEKHDLHLRTWYGIDRTEYLLMLEDQNWGCAICERREALGPSKRFHVDHCWKSHKIRGLLCNKCNTTLGWVERNEIAIVDYLTQDLDDRKMVRTIAINAAQRRAY